MDTVDKSLEVVWCDHLVAFGINLPRGRAVHLSGKKDAYIVAEEGKVKVICPSCFVVAIQIPLFDS